MLLTGILERQMGLPAGRLFFAHNSSKYEIPLDSKAGIGKDQEKKLLEIQDKLTKYLQVQAHIEISGKISEKNADRLLQILYKSAPLLADSSRAGVTIDRDRDRMVTITLRPMRIAS